MVKCGLQIKRKFRGCGQKKDDFKQDLSAVGLECEV